MDIKVINKSDNDLPIHATEQAAGLDLKAYLRPDTEYVGTGFSYDKVADVMYLFSGGRVVIPTGLHIELPVGYELQIRPRSGLAAKHGITVLNTPGTIDADYRGEICVCLINHSKHSFKVHHGDRIAQIIFSKVEQAILVEVSELVNTKRGTGGFGHTGIK